MNAALKTTLNYGSLTGLVSFLVFLLIYIFGENPLYPIGYIGILVTLFMIPFSMVQVRNKAHEGYIGYGASLVSGLLITLVYASLSSILVFMFLKFFDPSLVEEYKNFVLNQSEQGREMMGDDYTDFAQEQAEKLSVGVVAQGEFMNKVIGGLLISLIAAIFIKRKPSPFES